MSSISGESTTGTVVQTVPVVAPTEDTDEKTLLAENPCQITKYGGPPGLATSHTNSVRTLVLETESADRDLLLNQTANSQKSFDTTAEVVELGISVAFPEATPTQFGDRAEDRLSGTSNPRHSNLENVPDMSSDANVDDPDLLVGRSFGRCIGRCRQCGCTF